MREMNRRGFLARAGMMGSAGAGALAAMAQAADGGERPPNIVVIFADDLGYGDLGCTGHPTIHTPNLDRMAAEGMRLTQFYSAAPVCTPSRAALLTGRLPARSGMCSNSRRVLFPDSAGGLPQSEVTIAEALKGAGYATACIGKWHLGHLPEFLPTEHGFDEYFGIPYSNDMKPCPLLDGTRTVEEPADQTTLTARYTERAIRFIRRNRKRPFFLYFPHTFPHVPLFASDRFKGESLRGLYGDVVEELDWSVGQILETLRKRGLAENTLVIFTSDNGPWLTQHLRGGTAGLLRGGKGSTWEGGMREPALAWWPGKVPAGVTNAGMASTLDVLPTCLGVAGARLPDDRALDGHDLTPMLTRSADSPRGTMFFYRGSRLYACRKGPWKLHTTTQAGYGAKPEKHDRPVLYQLEHDPAEKYDVAAEHPDIVADIEKTVAEHTASFEPAPSQLEARIPKE